MTSLIMGQADMAESGRYHGVHGRVLGNGIAGEESHDDRAKTPIPILLRHLSLMLLAVAA